MGEPVPTDSTTVHAYATYILPVSESVIPVTPNILLPAGCTGLVEPDSRLVVRYHICGASQLVSLSPDFTFPIRVLNPTNKPVTFFCNMGLFTPSASIMSAVTTDNNAQKTPPSTANTSPVPVDLSSTNLDEEQNMQLKSLLSEIFLH